MGIFSPSRFIRFRSRIVTRISGTSSVRVKSVRLPIALDDPRYLLREFGLERAFFHGEGQTGKS